MNLLIAYDTWIRAKTTAILDWLYEWLFISQKVVERILIGTYVSGNLLELAGIIKHEFAMPLWLEVVVTCYLTGWLWGLHKKPCAARKALFHTDRIAVPLRTWWTIPVLIDSVTAFSGKIFDIGNCMEVVAFASIMYVFSVNSDGERGRKAKIAWNKVIELFGTQWMPQPVGANQ
jgi:hypothetical protein